MLLLLLLLLLLFIIFAIVKLESEKRRGGDGYDHVGSTPCNSKLNSWNYLIWKLKKKHDESAGVQKTNQNVDCILEFIKNTDIVCYVKFSLKSMQSVIFF